MLIKVYFEDCRTEWTEDFETDDDANINEAVKKFYNGYPKYMDNPTAVYLFHTVIDKRTIPIELPERIEAYAEDLYDAVFNMVDCEYGGEDAGYVADAVEKVFLTAMRKRLG